MTAPRPRATAVRRTDRPASSVCVVACGLTYTCLVRRSAHRHGRSDHPAPHQLPGIVLGRDAPVQQLQLRELRCRHSVPADTRAIAAAAAAIATLLRQRWRMLPVVVQPMCATQHTCSAAERFTVAHSLVPNMCCVCARRDVRKRGRPRVWRVLVLRRHQPAAAPAVPGAHAVRRPSVGHPSPDHVRATSDGSLRTVAQPRASVALSPRPLTPIESPSTHATRLCACFAGASTAPTMCRPS